MPIRKTVKERVLHAEASGFFDCLAVFEDAWREREWKTGRAGNPHGPGDPFADMLWELILKAMDRVRPVDDAWRKLYEARLDANQLEKQLLKNSPTP